MDIFAEAVMLEKQADDFGFSWEHAEQIIKQIQNEQYEIETHLDNPNQRQALQEEIGDLMHAVCSLCVFCNFDPRETFAKSLLKFEKRLHAVKMLAKQNGYNDLKGQSFETLMKFWEEAKTLTREV